MGCGIPKRVILTRQREDIEKDKPLFERYRFAVVELPLIRTERLDFTEPEDSFEYVVFQSAKAVRYFLDRAVIPEKTRIVAVGSKTAKELEKRGFKVWLVPKESSAEGVLKEFPKDGKGSVLIPRSEQGRSELIEGLRELGYRVIPLNIYRTVGVKYKENYIISVLGEGGFIVFASPSAVKSFFANLQNRDSIRNIKNLYVVSIGSTTKRELENYGLKTDLLPPKPLMEEVAGKIHRFWQENCKY